MMSIMCLQTGVGWVGRVGMVMQKCMWGWGMVMQSRSGGGQHWHRTGTWSKLCSTGKATARQTTQAWGQAVAGRQAGSSRQ